MMLRSTLSEVCRVWSSRTAWDNFVGLSGKRCRGCRLLSTTSGGDMRSLVMGGNASHDGDSARVFDVSQVATHYRTSFASLPSLPNDIINSAAQHLAQKGSFQALWRLLGDQLKITFHSDFISRPDASRLIVGHLYRHSGFSLTSQTILEILLACLKHNMRDGWAWYRALRTLSNQTLMAAYGPKAESWLPSLILVAGLAPDAQAAASRVRQVFQDEVLPTNIVLPPYSITLLSHLLLPLPRHQHSDLLFPYILQIDFTPSIEICEALVAQFCASELFDLVPQGLRLLLRAGRPSVDFYNNALTLYTKHQHSAVGIILEHMKASQTPPNLDTLSILLSAGLPNYMDLFNSGEAALSDDPRKGQMTEFIGKLVCALYKQGHIEEMNKVLEKVSVYGVDARAVYMTLAHAYSAQQERSSLAEELYVHWSKHDCWREEWLQDETFAIACVKCLAWARSFTYVRMILEYVNKHFASMSALLLCHVCDVCAMNHWAEFQEFAQLLRARPYMDFHNGAKQFRAQLLEGCDWQSGADYKAIRGKFDLMSFLETPPPSRVMLPFLHALLASFEHHYRVRSQSVWQDVLRPYFRYLTICRNSRLSIDIHTLDALLSCLIVELEVGQKMPVVESPESYKAKQIEVARLATLVEGACQWVKDREANIIFDAPFPQDPSSTSILTELRKVGSSELLKPTAYTWLRSITILALAKPFLSTQKFEEYRALFRKHALNADPSEEASDALWKLYAQRPEDVGGHYSKQDAIEAVDLFRTLRAHAMGFPEEEFACGILRGLRDLQLRSWAPDVAKDIGEFARNCIAELHRVDPPLALASTIVKTLVQLSGRDTLALGKIFAMCQQARLTLDLPLCLAFVQAAAQPNDLTTMLRYLRGDFANDQAEQATTETHGERTLEQRLRECGDDGRLVAYFSGLEPFKIENNKEPRSNDKRFSFRHLLSTQLKGSIQT